MYKIINFKSELPKTFLAPSYDYNILENNIGDNVNINEILTNVEKRYNHLLSTLENEVDKTEQSIRYLIFNKQNLKEEYIINLIDVIKKNLNFYYEYLRLPKPPRLWLQLWCNFLSKNNYINIHQHQWTGCSFLSGNLCLKTKNTSTYYLNPQRYFVKNNEVYNSKNEVGKLTIFPSTLPHWTDKVVDDEMRVTLAFDVMIEQDEKMQMHKNKEKFFENNIIEI
jgi:hypothetical protein